MDVHMCAMPNFFLNLMQLVQQAKDIFLGAKNEQPFHIPLMIGKLFFTKNNLASKILSTYY